MTGAVSNALPSFFLPQADDAAADAGPEASVRFNEAEASLFLEEYDLEFKFDVETAYIGDHLNGDVRNAWGDPHMDKYKAKLDLDSGQTLAGFILDAGESERLYDFTNASYKEGADGKLDQIRNTATTEILMNKDRTEALKISYVTYERNPEIRDDAYEGKAFMEGMEMTAYDLETGEASWGVDIGGLNSPDLENFTIETFIGEQARALDNSRNDGQVIAVSRGSEDMQILDHETKTFSAMEDNYLDANAETEFTIEELVTALGEGGEVTDSGSTDSGDAVDSANNNDSDTNVTADNVFAQNPELFTALGDTMKSYSDFSTAFFENASGEGELSQASLNLFNDATGAMQSILDIAQVLLGNENTASDSPADSGDETVSTEASESDSGAEVAATDSGADSESSEIADSGSDSGDSQIFAFESGDSLTEFSASVAALSQTTAALLAQVKEIEEA